ncbi:VWA domain-containing protein [Waterburya agarophytonicola K14]|uniref:VWA domain-containing protein n=1 Tax=Waterburya agarophytonicola KI4 TaxID=2874699 RepID=A0A964FF38_9CYAN|nr:VWA domain-containing protein [Waterburya agarophytonicola]MCC0176607.1 VWA domain-containing protein [Waterburya agarophytonicola KI4]
MKVGLQSYLSDSNIDAQLNTSQRQLSLAISAVPEDTSGNLPLNLCLVLDRSGSMSEKPLEMVKEAAVGIIEKLKPGDRISIVTFDHRAKVIVPNQLVNDIQPIKQKIRLMVADGGTSIDEGMRLGIKEIASHNQHCVSRLFLLTDGENEHGDNKRCLKLAELAAEYNITIDALGFGEHWNQDVLEQISDSAQGTLAYIEKPDRAVFEFQRLFARAQSVGLTNSYLTVELMPKVRLAELKPVAQISPETIELTTNLSGNHFSIRLGDLMIDRPRIILINFYINQLSPGKHKIAGVQLRYDDPGANQENLHSDVLAIEVDAQAHYFPYPSDIVQNHILTLAKYRQTQIAETKLKGGDRVGAATMLQTAAKTALQLGDKQGATVLQTNATRLQIGKDLSEGDRKKTRLASKTILKNQ